ncbi:MAG: autotransporter domain-containing protein, partial [Desulfobacteraceae bacterium]|nr:autotransporter domain-containing protein [Desulfobacteraceae bacterium]
MIPKPTQIITFWTIFIFFFLAFHPLALSRVYAALYAFGDSAIDNGNVFILTESTEPASPYWEGRFTNGFNYLDHIAAAVPGWEAFPFFSGGTNYAAGGAQSGTGYVLGGIPNVGQQIVEYPLIVSVPFAQDDMILLSMGQNDLLFNQDNVPIATQIADNFIQNIQMVYDLGGRRIMLPSAFPMHLMPEVANISLSIQAEAKQWVEDLNTAVETRLVQFRAANPDVLIVRTDFTARISDVYDHPEKYGLSNVTQNAYTGDFFGNGAVVTDPNNYLWWDGAHVTARVQELIAQWMLADTQDMLYPNQAAPQAGLAVIQSSLDHIRMISLLKIQGLSTSLGSPKKMETDKTGDQKEETPSVKKRTAFYLTPLVTWGNQSSQGIADGWKWENTGLILGGDFQFAPGWLGGISVNYNEGKVDLDRNSGRAENRLVVVDTYTGFKSNGFLFLGGMGYGNADNEAFREISLTQTRAKSDFDSDIGFCWTEMGYEIPIKPNLNLIPLGGLDYSHLNHKSLNETQGGLLAYETLDYGDSDHLRHRLGARITGDHKISDTLEWQ